MSSYHKTKHSSVGVRLESYICSCVMGIAEISTFVHSVGKQLHMHDVQFGFLCRIHMRNLGPGVKNILVYWI